jgi:hypothetical protein
MRRFASALNIRNGIVRAKSILRFGNSGAGGSLLFLLMNRARRDRDLTPKIAYTDLL